MRPQDSAAVRFGQSGETGRWVIGGVLVAALGRFFVLLVVGSQLGSADLGRFVLWQATVAMAATLGSLGMTRAGLILVGAELGEGGGQSANGAALMSLRIAGFGGALAGVAAALMVSNAMPGRGLLPATITFAWVVAESLRAPASEMHRARGRIKLATLTGDGGRLAAACVLSFLVLPGNPGLLHFGGAAAAASVASMSAAVGASWVRGSASVSASEAGRLGLSMMGIDVISVAQRQALVWVGATVLTLGEVGWFAVGQRSVGLLGLILVALNHFVTPSIVAAELPRQAGSLTLRLRHLTDRAFAASGVGAVGFIVIAVPVLQGLLDVPLSGLVVLVLAFSLAQIVNAATGPSGLVLALRGHHLVVQRYGLYATVALLAGGLVGGSLFGVIGLSVAAALVAIVRTLITATACRRLTAVDARSSVLVAVSKPLAWREVIA